MRITTKVAAAGVAGAVSLGGLGLVLGSPLATAATTAVEEQVPAPVGERLEAITQALAGLITDGTITQEQGDTVATTLERSGALRGHEGLGGPGGHGGRGGPGGLALGAAADALGLSTEELREALDVDGATLATVAADRDVEEATLVDALVTAGTERSTAGVGDGRLTQAQADELTAALPERIAAVIDEELPELHGGRRHGRFGPWGGDRDA